MTRKWPQPGTIAVDRARQIAQTCWEALARVDPAAAKLIAGAAAAAGESWLGPQAAKFQPDDLVSVPEAAELAGRSVRWAYQWVADDRDNRAVIGRDKRIRVRVGTLLDCLANEQTHGAPTDSP